MDKRETTIDCGAIVGHAHLCLDCGIVVARGNFDCDINNDHDFERCERCAAEVRDGEGAR